MAGTIFTGSMGNLFGFKRQILDSRPDDSALFFFYHDFDTITQETPSFDAWLDAFLKLPGPPTST